MQSSLTKLLQTAIWAKLQSWLGYINGRDNSRYRLTKEPDKFTIWQRVPDAPSWQFRILTLRFDNDLELSTAKKKTIISYSDPELYKKLFAIIDASENGDNFQQPSYLTWKGNSEIS